MSTAEALMTAEEFGQRSDPGHPEELVRGRIVSMPPADRRHGFVCCQASFLLRQFLSEHDLGRVMTNDSGVITERDVLHAVAKGQNPDEERVADHLTAKLTFAEPSWSLEHAAQTMVKGGFRHLVVVDGSDMVGILSMRDIVRVWSGLGAACDVPEPARS